MTDLSTTFNPSPFFKGEVAQRAGGDLPPPTYFLQQYPHPLTSAKEVDNGNSPRVYSGNKSELMTIRKKLLLILTFPLLVIIGLSAVQILDLYNLQRDVSKINQLVKLSATSGELIHEIQKERGMSVGYIGSKGDSFEEELNKQRSLVDTKVNAFRTGLASMPPAYLSQALTKDFNEINAEIDRFAEVRNQVSELAIPAGSAASFFTGINKKIIKGIAGTSSLTDDSEISQLVTGYSLYLSGKDYAGIERAMLSAAFAADQFNTTTFNVYMNAKASQEEDFNKFVFYASEGTRSAFEAFTQGEAYQEVSRLRSIADSQRDAGGFGVDPLYWFSAISKKINLLKDIEDFQAKEIIALSEARQNEAKSTILIYAIVLTVTLILVLLSGRTVMLSIVQPLEDLLDNAASVSIGHTNIEPVHEVHDELGGATFMFHTMMENIKENMEQLEQEKALAHQAVQKAERLQEETQESEKVLKKSVRTMLVALESFADGDLSTELPHHQNHEINRLYKGYNTALSKVRSLILKLKHVTEQTSKLTAGTNEIGHQIEHDTNHLSNQSSDSSTTTMEMAEGMASTAELATSTSKISIESGQAAEEGIQIVEKTVQRIQSIADSVNQCVEVIDRLGRSSQEITGIISVIEDIAEQTNLLALNAAIEAARAGESGRGFAVVADEVRSLSERTKDSTRKIESVIRSLNTDTSNAVEVMQEGQQLVNDGLQLADKAHHALQGIGENVKTMVQVVTRIASSVETEASRSNQIAQQMKDIDKDAQQTNESAEQIVQSLRHLDALSSEITTLVEKFNVGLPPHDKIAQNELLHNEIA